MTEVELRDMQARLQTVEQKLDSAISRLETFEREKAEIEAQWAQFAAAAEKQVSTVN
jgi:uncharacterized protein (UPF0335 family)